MKIFFNIHYFTQQEERLEILVFHDKKGFQKYPLSLVGDGIWKTEVDYFSRHLTYIYQVVNIEGVVIRKELKPHLLNFPHNFKEYQIFDEWNNKNFPENYLNNKILQQKLADKKFEKIQILKRHTHLFRIEAPLYNPNWSLVISGNDSGLGNWELSKIKHLQQTDFGVWEISLSLQNSSEIEYKFGIYDHQENKVLDLEIGPNRKAKKNEENDVLYIVSNHYFKFKSAQLYHAAGVAIPVFSIRTENGFGIGEFDDIKLLVDWAKKCSLSMVQLLPINDTSSQFSWTDSYPYAAISVYALHPIYISIEKLDFQLTSSLVDLYKKERCNLNVNNSIDYEKVISLKWKFLKSIFLDNKMSIYKDRLFKKFFKENKEWLIPYASFCYLRDQNKSPNFNNWKTHRKYIHGKILVFFDEKFKGYDDIMLHVWVQFQLHKQLKSSVDYAHGFGVSLKGDLPIGIYKYSVEAWSQPELFGMDFQAGAPPDSFAELGQNWEFPTYNWEVMKRDNYSWWKNRFKALENYFDALRIDHILGFFRIWRMPISATQGILGYFYPAIPVTKEEFQAKQIPFDEERFCSPYITEDILHEYFRNELSNVFSYFKRKENGLFEFKEAFNTQRKIKEYFELQPKNDIEDRLLELSANVLFIIEEKNGISVYHPRFNLDKTQSFNDLPEAEKVALRDLYEDYFFRRQDLFWKQNAMDKLPILLNSTKMLICAEDLGMVPKCVPEVMDELGIVALKVQRMPSDNIPYYNPKNATYLNVVTASSHDSSTLRQWWKEDDELTQKYYNEQLQQFGNTPKDLEPYLAEIIMKQHLYNDAMLAIFPMQEFLALDNSTRNDNIDEERINDPSVFPHFWKYRMHITLEKLIEKQDFSLKISSWIKDSSRI